MNNSAEMRRPGPSAPPIKKAAKQFDELSFLNTPNKNSRRPANTPSVRGTPSGPFTPRLSAQRDLIAQDALSSPFSPASKLQASSTSKTENLSSPASRSKSLTSAELTANFLSRPEPFKTTDTLNNHLPAFTEPTTRRPATPLHFDFTKYTSPEKYKYRYMFEKLSDRSDVLDRQLEQVASIIAEWYEIEEWSDPTTVSQDDIWAVGRICVETQDSKLSDQACWLETSRMVGHGRRIRLQWTDDLQVQGVGTAEGGIGLFPGAIVGLRGRNGGGTYFSVQEILSMPMAEPAMTLPQDLLNFLPSAQTPISIIAACGPFTWDEDLDFLPFEALINQLTKEKPDCVILLGPFIDVNHPMIKTGDIDQMPSAIFREKIASRLHRLSEISPSSQIVLVPSQRDFLATHAVFPQAAFDAKDPELGLSFKNITCLPNPAMICINEIIIGINNVDVLMPLRKEEFFKPALVVNQGLDDGDDPHAKDIISRACRHVMRQRNFYPIFPPTIGAGIDLVNLDVTHLDLLRHKTVAADVLIMPTSFTTFAKAIDSTVVVNPRYLCKGKGTGTFAKFTIHAFDKESIETAKALNKSTSVGGDDDDGEEDDDDKLEHLIFRRCRVDVIKI